MKKLMTSVATFAALTLTCVGVASAQSVEVCGKSVAPDTRVLICQNGNLGGVEKLTKLQKLKVRGGLDDAGLAPLAEHPTLEVLDIEGASVGNEGVVHLGSITTLQALNLAKTKVTDAGLEPLKSLVVLRRLSLRGTEIDGDGLVYLAEMPLLKWLDLTDTEVHDETIPQLTNLRSVRDLQLNGTKLSPSGVLEVRKALPQADIKAKGLGKAFQVCGQTVTADMKVLVCDEGFTDGEQLAKLRDITSLEELTIRGGALDDRAMRHIQGDTLQRLDLTGTFISDVGVAKLRKLPALEMINLTKTRVTDEGLMELKDLDSLREIFVAGTGVTKRGVATFRKAKSNCRVVR